MTDAKRDVMDRLERAIGRLADGTARLDDLVRAHQEALRLLDEAEAELTALRVKADEISQTIAS